MVGELASRKALSREVVEGVSERTGGVPLFVEEVTRLLLERGEAGGLQAIPPTLQQSLAARLDRLGEAREVAQIGAVLGRDFSYALLRALAPRVGGVDEPAVHAVGDRDLQSALDRLVDADLLFVQGAGAQATYRFKHALIRDAASTRACSRAAARRSHRRAGEILRDKPEGAAVAAPESHRASLHRGLPRRSRDRMVGQSGRPGAPPLQPFQGGDRPSRQGDRDGGQDSGWGVPDQFN